MLQQQQQRQQKMKRLKYKMFTFKLIKGNFRLYSNSVLSNWERFHKGIHQYGLYSGEDPAVDGILDDMVQEQVVDIGKKRFYARSSLECILTELFSRQNSRIMLYP